MRLLPIVCAALFGPFTAAVAQPYDFSAADALLTAELPKLDGNVAVIVRQDGREIYRFQAGSIDYDTKTRLASFTKTISAPVILSLAEDGLLDLDERIGDALPLFDDFGLGDPTIRDAWAMRHGVDSLIPYEHDRRFTLAESVNRIARFGFLGFTPPASQLGYDGAGMQITGLIAEQRTGLAWDALARARVFDPCQMTFADYAQFDPNPAVAGGARSSALETINLAQMIIDDGVFGGATVLTPASIEIMFTNHTRGLPVFKTPWPADHPLYPYGVDPDYAFGAWVLAEHPDSGHVEEIVGAGAWGSYIWIDRRRALTAVLITDIRPGSQASMDAALGLCAIVRTAVDTRQPAGVSAIPLAGKVCVSWDRVDAATESQIYGSTTPIRNIFDLRAATLLAETSDAAVRVPYFEHYAVTHSFDDFRNPALAPGRNAVTASPYRPDLNQDGTLDIADLEILFGQFAKPGPDVTGDLDNDADVDLRDFAIFQQLYHAAGC